MNPIPESELILDKRGAIYHLGVRPEELANTVIVVGDPDRVPVVSKYFDKIEHQLAHREFVTDRKSTRLNSSHSDRSRMPSSA